MKRSVWFVVGVVLLAVLVPGGVTVVAVQLIAAARGRREVFDQVAQEVTRQLGELAPHLTPEQALRAGEIVGAQAVHETGGGATIAWRLGWNFGNVTAGSARLWPGPVVEGPDTEYDAQGNVKNIGQRFRKYDTLSAAVSDFLTQVLNWTREVQAGARDRLYEGDAEGYARALSAAGYYTAPVESYVAATASILRKYGATA